MEISEAKFTELIEQSLVKAKPSLINKYELKYQDFEDCLQTAMVKAWRNKHRLNDDNLFGTWFYAILRNEIVTFLFKDTKKRKIEVLHEDFKYHNDNEDIKTKSNFLEFFSISPFIENLETPYSVLDNKEKLEKKRQFIENALFTLEPNHAQILKMVFQDEKSYKEVAEELKIPLGTVMSRVYYARENAKKLLTNAKLVH